MTEQAARETASKIPATPGVKVGFDAKQIVAPNAVDVIWNWSVEIEMRDAKHGNVATHTIREAGEIDGAAIVKSLVAEIKTRAKRVRAARATASKMGR